MDTGLTDNPGHRTRTKLLAGPDHPCHIIPVTSAWRIRTL